MNTVTKYFSPFYDFARRKLHVSPEIVDHYLNGGGASINNRTITLRDPRGIEHHANIGVGHRRHATRWVDEFNNRVVKTLSY